MDPIKITSLPPIGNNVLGNTVVPVVDMAGTPTTEKATVANIANLILTQAGNSFLPAGMANIANFAGQAGSVSNSIQPNITSVGIMSNLTIEGLVNLGNVSNIIIYGGNSGAILTTDGTGSLSWIPTSVIGAYGNADVANYLPVYTGNISGDYIELTHDVTANVVAANYLYGDGSNITNIPGTGYSNSNVANYLPNYAGNISAGNIFVATEIQINSGGNIYEDGNALIVRTEPTHIFEIWGNDGASDYKWSFDADGHLTLPGNTAYIRGDVNLMQVYCNDFAQSGFSLFTDFELSATDNVKIFTNNSNTPYIWNFDDSGNLTLPGNSFAVNYANGSPVPLGDTSILINGDNSFVLDNDGNVVFEGADPGQGINRGLVWDYGANTGGVNSELRQDNNGITVRAWTETGEGTYAAPVNIVTNQDANTNTWTFDGQGNLTVPSGSINSISDSGDLGAYITLTPDLGLARLSGREAQSSVNYTSTSWSNATYTGTQIDFTDAPDLVTFFNNNTFNVGVNQTISINGDEPVPFTGYTIGVSNAVTVYTSVAADPDPTTVTSIDFFSQLESYVAVDYDDGALNINATGLTINIDNDQTSGPDINLRSGDDITLQAKDKDIGSESEGGDINIYAGDGADDDGLGNTASTGGDIQITAGNGGDGNSSSGSTGGFTTIRGGTGGAAGVTNTAGPGGYVSIQGGDGGNDTGNTSLGAVGGNVSITAGLTTQEGVNGPDVTITSGQGGPNALAGSVVISTPGSANGFGGTWVFDGNGLLTFPGTPRIDTYTNNFEVQAAESINFEANAVVNIYTDTSNNAYQWQFGDDGNLILAGGNSVIQSIANSSLDPVLPNVSTMVFTPDSGYGSQALVLDPTAPGHIHLRAPGANIDEPYANIFLGGETTSFEVTQGLNNVAKIHSGGNTWTFGNDGVTTSPVLTVDQLPVAIAGMRAFVSDSNLAPVGNFGAIVGNSGSNTVSVWSDGTNWRIG